MKTPFYFNDQTEEKTIQEILDKLYQDAIFDKYLEQNDSSKMLKPKQKFDWNPKHIKK